MSVSKLSIAFTALLCVPFAAGTASAQDDQDQARGLKRLVQLLDEIEKALKSMVPARSVEARLKERTPSYRVVVVETPKPAGDAGSGDVTDEAAGRPTSQPKSRVLGDTEKDSLPDGTVIVVDGSPITGEEVNELAEYFASYLDGNASDHMARATAELIKVHAVQAAFNDELPELRQRIEEYHKKALAPDADFAAVAKEHSECPSAPTGGELGQFGRDQMVAPFARWAFTTSVGKISPVFASHFGFHFLKVTGRQKGGTPAQAESRASHVLVMYTKDRNKLMEIATRAETGKCDVAVIDAKWREHLPAGYR